MDRTSTSPHIEPGELLARVEQLVLKEARLMAAWNLLKDVPDEALSEELRRWKWGLDPTEVYTSGPYDQVNTLSANQPWLDAHKEEHRGEWVALYCGELLATGESMTTLAEKLDVMGRRQDALVIRL